MKYGFYLPTRGPLAEPDAITAIVRGGAVGRPGALDTVPVDTHGGK